MKRAAFEQLVENALARLAADVCNDPARTATTREAPFCGVVYDAAERQIGNAVAALTAPRHGGHHPLPLPCPELLPPCF